MLIEHEGEQYRAIRCFMEKYMTSCGLLIPANECLVYAQGIWWLNRQVKVDVNVCYKNVGIRIPEHPGEVRTAITGVRVPARECKSLANLNCITPP